jgi:hypothetical protein
MILRVASFINREYLNEDLIDDLADDLKEGEINTEYENLKELLKENGSDGCYYPLRNLYATCSSFSYLNELEYICIEEGELYYNIVSRNINGSLHGLTYNGTINTGILGYSIYDNGKMIKENHRYNDYHYHYRKIDGIKYFEDENCERWFCSCSINCQNCIQLNKIQKHIFEKDPFIEEMFKVEYDDCTVIIRTPLKLELVLDYNSDHLKLVS